MTDETVINDTLAVRSAVARKYASWHLFVPKLVTALGEGYRPADARADLFAGLTVSVVALPLSLALAIACGVAPGRGLFTAVVLARSSRRSVGAAIRSPDRRA